MDEGAQMLIRNGLAQNDLDMNNNRLLNLDFSNLPIQGQPPTVELLEGYFLNGWDAVTQTWGYSRVNVFRLEDFPDTAGNNGKFLQLHLSQLRWSDEIGGDFINVKNSPYNAVGDGVSDDYIAISNAFAAAGQKTVFFPAGVYFVSQTLSPVSPVNIQGDSSVISGILGAADKTGAVLVLPQGSRVQDIFVDGNLATVVQPAPTARDGITSISNGVTIERCVVKNCARHGISLLGSVGSTVKDCSIDSCGVAGISAENSPSFRATGNKITHCTGNGILLTNSPYTALDKNEVRSCAVIDYGIALYDSDNTVVANNRVQQCALGIVSGTTSGRLMQSYGMVFSGNNITRNYEGGIKLILSNGFNFSGNVVSDNGQGGQDNDTYTLEPGIVVDPGNRGTGYQVGDVLTLTGGTGAPAKLIVTKVNSGVIALDGVHPITLGKYSSFSGNPYDHSGGHGTGAKFFMSGGIIGNGGTLYKKGEVLRGTNGSFTNPIRIIVKTVDPFGKVTDFEVLDGGGYAGASLPAVPILFTPDSLSDSQGTGSGFSLAHSFAKRYSTLFNGSVPFGVKTLGPISGGVIGNNIISTTRNGVGILVTDDTAPFNGRANHLTITGNNMMNNLYGLRGQTVGDPLDINYNFFSVIDNNVISPII